MEWTFSLSVLCLGLLVGYALGRRQGRGEGFGLGAAYAPLELRRRALLTGRCAICAAAPLV